jgi:DNA-binding protein H-NS
MAAKVNLKLMSVEKLSKLRVQVEATLASKVADERRALESELTKLSRIGVSQGRERRATARGKVPAKYRNPENPAETWAGRGLKPRWLAAAIKAGKKLEHFAIAAAAKTTAVRKSRRPAKK